MTLKMTPGNMIDAIAAEILIWDELEAELFLTQHVQGIHFVMSEAATAVWVFSRYSPLL